MTSMLVHSVFTYSVKTYSSKRASQDAAYGIYEIIIQLYITNTQCTLTTMRSSRNRFVTGNSSRSGSFRLGFFLLGLFSSSSSRSSSTLSISSSKVLESSNVRCIINKDSNGLQEIGIEKSENFHCFPCFSFDTLPDQQRHP